MGARFVLRIFAETTRREGEGPEDGAERGVKEERGEGEKAR